MCARPDATLPIATSCSVLSSLATAHWTTSTKRCEKSSRQPCAQHTPGAGKGRPSSTPSLSLKRSKTAKLRWQGIMQMAWRDLEMTEQNGKTSPGEAADSAPTVIGQVSSGSLPLVQDDASATDDESATVDFTGPEPELRDATLPDGEDAAVA